MKKAVESTLPEKCYAYNLHGSLPVRANGFLVGFAATIDGIASVPYTSLTSSDDNSWLDSMNKDDINAFKQALLVIDIFDMHTTNSSGGA